MKKTLLLITLIFVSLTNILAQSDSTKWIATVQFGLISEMPQNGSFVSFDVEKKLKKKGYSIGLSFLKGETNHLLDDKSAALLKSNNKIRPYIFEIISFSFNKEIEISKKSNIVFGLGLSNIAIQRTDAVAEQYGANTYYRYSSYTTSDMGVLANLQYSYQIRKNIGLGVQIKTLHSTIEFLEAIMIAPTLRFKIY